MTRTTRPGLMFGLWALTGLAWVVSVLGLLTIGIFVAPVAVALLATSVVLTVRRPERWPSVAGLGLALAVGLGWLGVVLGRADPSSGSCSATADGVVTCSSGGQAFVPGTFDAAVAAPWLGAAAVVAVLAVAAWVAASTRVRASGVGT